MTTPAKNKPLTAVIIVGHNSFQYLEDCFYALKQSAYQNFQIIFVDNNSSDDSVEFIKREFSNIKLIVNKENLGFAGANNLGAKEALVMKADYLFLLNPDTVIDPECLGRLVEVSDEKTILQPLILLYQNEEKTNRINTAGNIVNFLGFSYCGQYQKNIESAKNIKEVSAASGAAMFVPAKIICRIGLFDQRFFMYHEDVDFSWRAWLAGYRIRLVPMAKVWHKYSFSKNKNKMLNFERNRLLFLLKNFSFKYCLLIFPAIIVNEIAIVAFSLVNGWFKLKLKSYFSFLRLAPYALGQRQKICKLKIASEKQLKRLIQPELDFSEVGGWFFKPYNILLSFYWRLISTII